MMPPDPISTFPASTDSKEGTAPPRGYGVAILLIVLTGVILASDLLVPLAQGQKLSWSWFVGAYNGWVAAVIVILVLVLLLYSARRAFGVSGDPRERRERRRGRFRSMYPLTASDPALSIARERYARGEISKDQFNEITGELGGASGPARSH
jgi:uncharacterized membrane protein